MKSRFIPILTFLILCLPLTDLAAKPPASVDTYEERIATLEALVHSLQSQITANDGDISTNLAAIDANNTAIAAIGPHFGGDHADLTNVTQDQHHVPTSTDLTAINNAIAFYDDLLAGVSRFDDDPRTNYTDTLRFTGMNVQVVNDSGTTYGTPDGAGNLIIGYNELRTNPTLQDDARTGSHMLVIGTWNNYSSYGGMVVGNTNTVSGGFSSVSGGTGNVASGYQSSVSGGKDNEASYQYSSVSGGNLNTASGKYASISGGAANVVSGFWSSISGGSSKTAAGTGCTVGDNGVDC